MTGPAVLRAFCLNAARLHQRAAGVMMVGTATKPSCAAACDAAAVAAAPHAPPPPHATPMTPAELLAALLHAHRSIVTFPPDFDNPEPPLSSSSACCAGAARDAQRPVLALAVAP